MLNPVVGTPTVETSTAPAHPEAAGDLLKITYFNSAGRAEVVYVPGITQELIGNILALGNDAIIIHPAAVARPKNV